jgi:hypothetical protein
LRADFQRVYRLDSDDIEGIGVQRAADLAANLPPGSMVWIRLNKPAAWTTTDYLLAGVFDEIARFQYMLSDHKGSGPKPLPRPGETVEKQHTQQVMSMTPEELDAWYEQQWENA